MMLGNQKRKPIEFANLLLKETKFSAKEISDLCGLDIYKVTALKLKSRTVEKNLSC